MENLCSYCVSALCGTCYTAIEELTTIPWIESAGQWLAFIVSIFTILAFAIGGFSDIYKAKKFGIPLDLISFNIKNGFVFVSLTIFNFSMLVMLPMYLVVYVSGLIATLVTSLTATVFAILVNYPSKKYIYKNLKNLLFFLPYAVFSSLMIWKGFDVNVVPSPQEGFVFALLIIVFFVFAVAHVFFILQNKMTFHKQPVAIATIDGKNYIVIMQSRCGKWILIGTGNLNTETIKVSDYFILHNLDNIRLTPIENIKIIGQF